MPTEDEFEEDRSEHTVLIGGVEHTLLLDDNDKDRLADSVVTKAKTPQNKSKAAAKK